MSGYSGTPLAAKLGIAPGLTLALLNAPRGYRSLVGPALRRAKVIGAVTGDTDLVHLFETSKPRLATLLDLCLRHMNADAAIWVSWPKKSSGVTTDITEDTIRQIALPMGLVDVKVCAVDDTWSGLRFVVRKENRAGWRAGA